MKKLAKLLFTILILSAFDSCDIIQESKQITGEMTVSLVPGQWTYISIETGEVVGTSLLGDKVSDEAWAGRNDWDIAICDSLIRSNGGKSGMGQGAISDVSSVSTVPDTYQDIW